MGINRRSVLQFLAVGAATTLATPIPWKGLDDLSIWTQNFPWIPRIPKGNAEYKTAVSKFCSSFSGAKVGMIQNNPFAVYADDANPFSLGGISSFAATEVQMLYSPSRIKTPLLRTKQGFSSITWAEAFTIIGEKITQAGTSIAMISGDDTSSANDIFSAILANNNATSYFFMPSERIPAQQAWFAMGEKGLVTYQYDKADLVIAVGANVMDSWGLSTRFARLHQEKKFKLAYVGSYADNTFAVADIKTTIAPGKEVLFLLAVLTELVNNGYRLPSMDAMMRINTILQENFTKRDVLHDIGITKRTLQSFVKKLTAAQNPLIITGSPSTTGTPAALPLLGFIITSMLSQEPPVANAPFLSQGVEGAQAMYTFFHNDLVQYLYNLQDQPPLKLMLTYNANPLYALPTPKKIQQIWSTIAYKVAIASFMDETVLQSDLILPLALSLEAQDDAYTPYGSDKTYYLVTTPVISPVVDAKSPVDVALSLAKKLNIPLSAQTADEIFTKKRAELHNASASLDGAILQQSPQKSQLATIDIAPITSYLASLPKRSTSSSTALLAVLPFSKLYMGKPTTSVPPFNVKTIPHTLYENEQPYVLMNSSTAHKFALTEGATLQLTTTFDESSSIVVKLRIDEGIVNDTIGILVGMGHTAFDAFTKNKGVNAMELVSVTTDDSFVSSWTQNFVKIQKI